LIDVAKPLNWDDLRIFIVVARIGKLGAAAKKLQLDHTTVSRRIGVLEKTLGEKLLNRSPVGVTLTPRGTELFAHAEGIETELSLASKDLGGASTHMSGVVRVATPEGFGALLVTASMAGFLEEYPEIEIELIPEARPISLSKHEADVVLSIQRPPRGRLFCKKLTDYRLGLYASEAYLAARGTPTSLDAFKTHDVVWFIEDLLPYPKFRYYDHIASGAEVAFRSTSIVAQMRAVASGIGIGLLPHYLAVNHKNLVRLLPNISVDQKLWIILHATHRNTPRVRAVVAFLERLITQNRAVLLAE
jgi:DNA-binding transcriptional LysR family regulator